MIDELNKEPRFLGMKKLFNYFMSILSNLCRFFFIKCINCVFMLEDMAEMLK